MSYIELKRKYSRKNKKSSKKKEMKKCPLDKKSKKKDLKYGKNMIGGQINYKNIFNGHIGYIIISKLGYKSANILKYTNKFLHNFVTNTLDDLYFLHSDNQDVLQLAEENELESLNQIEDDIDILKEIINHNETILESGQLPVWMKESELEFINKLSERLETFFYFGERLLHYNFVVDVSDKEFISVISKTEEFILNSFNIEDLEPSIISFFTTEYTEIDCMGNELFISLWRTTTHLMKSFLSNYIKRIVFSKTKEEFLYKTKEFFSIQFVKYGSQFSEDYSFIGLQDIYTIFEPLKLVYNEYKEQLYTTIMNAYYLEIDKMKDIINMNTDEKRRDYLIKRLTKLEKMTQLEFFEESLIDDISTLGAFTMPSNYEDEIYDDDPIINVYRECC